jgi:hypothetical protein
MQIRFTNRNPFTTRLAGMTPRPLPKPAGVPPHPCEPLPVVLRPTAAWMTVKEALWHIRASTRCSATAVEGLLRQQLSLGLLKFAVVHDAAVIEAPFLNRDVWKTATIFVEDSVVVLGFEQVSSPVEFPRSASVPQAMRLLLSRADIASYWPVMPMETRNDRPARTRRVDAVAAIIREHQDALEGAAVDLQLRKVNELLKAKGHGAVSVSTFRRARLQIRS